MKIYLVIKRDEHGKIFENRVFQWELVKHIAESESLGIELLAVIQL